MRTSRTKILPGEARSSVRSLVLRRAGGGDSTSVLLVSVSFVLAYTSLAGPWDDVYLYNFNSLFTTRLLRYLNVYVKHAARRDSQGNGVAERKAEMTIFSLSHWESGPRKVRYHGGEGMGELVTHNIVGPIHVCLHAFAHFVNTVRLDNERGPQELLLCARLYRLWGDQCSSNS